MAACTAKGDIREYDYRASRRTTLNSQVNKNEMYLSHIMKSTLNDNHLYVITQEGHPIVVDRRFNHRVIRKMPGAKGSVRDAKLFGGIQNKGEFLVTVGCDRHLRVFDAMKEVQSDTHCGSAYLK